MDNAARLRLARQAIGDYETGHAAPARATARALARIGAAATVVLVEGISDQAAVETAAAARGRDLGAERVVVAPIGGAHAVGGFLPQLPAGVRVAGLCDRREEPIFRRGLAGVAVVGLFVCAEDLEDELIRAVGTAAVEGLFAAQGDAGSFASMRGQPAWRGRPVAAQMRRFLGSGSRRKLRYARLLAGEAVARDVLPRPLHELLDAL